MAASDELASLLQSAADLGIPHDPGVRYVSRQTVLRGMRFHFTEWGDQSAPPVVLLHGGNQSLHSWDLVSLHLADRYHVFALDQRGRFRNKLEQFQVRPHSRVPSQALPCLRRHVEPAHHHTGGIRRHLRLGK